MGSKVLLLEGRSRISIVGSSISYYNSRKGFENPEDLNFDKITAQITASITKPSPVRLVKSVPTKQQQDDEALVDMIEKMDKEKIDKTTEGTSDNIVELVEVEKDSKENSKTIVDSEEVVGKEDVESPANG